MHKAITIPSAEREKTAGMTGASLTVTEKREALEEVLQSERFFRAEQLRNFLRYICEMELAGRGSELCESLIGIQALGRPANYTPTEDASVRRRASDLYKGLKVHRREIREYAQTHHSWDAVAGLTRNIYADLLGSK